MSPFEGVQKPLKPAEFAEKQLLEAIIDGIHGPGDNLPAERVLARSLGVTRPTLRETLQRLSKEGWVTISHGKPTRVNDYLSFGGLGILNALCRFNNSLSPDMIIHLLEARTLILPGVVQRAVAREPDTILAYLNAGVSLDMDAKTFSHYDWELQMLMAKTIGNPVLKMMFNDFAPVYHRLGQLYFTRKKARQMSLEYYDALSLAIETDSVSVHGLVEKTMAQAQSFWQTI